jgi:multidrug resistance efflux pump
MAEEKKENLEQEIKEEVSREVKTFERRVMILAAAVIIVIGGGVAATSYFLVSSGQVSIDKSQIEAPQVDLAPTVSGILQNIFVEEGQTIAPNTVVAQVGNQLIKSTAGGLVISASNDVGENVAAGTPVVSTIDPTQLRVVGQVDENKGLSSIVVGDAARFTVDAFGGQSFSGVVDEVSPTSHASGVVFDISNERQTQTFDVKVYYDTAKYPQLKNGMSARIWVYTK